MDYSKTAEFLKALRKAKGMTQQEVADALYLSPKTISRWESGDGLPDINVIASVASLYEVSVDEILRGEKDGVKETIAPSPKSKAVRKRLEASLIKKYRLFELLSASIGGGIYLLGIILFFSNIPWPGFIVSLVGWVVGLALILIGHYYRFPRYDEEIDDDFVRLAKDNAGKTLRKEGFAFHIGYTIAICIIFILGLNFALQVHSDFVYYRDISILFILVFFIGFDLPLSVTYHKGGDMKKAIRYTFVFASMYLVLVMVHAGIIWNDHDVLRNLIGPYASDRGFPMFVLPIVVGLIEIGAIVLSSIKKWIWPMYAFLVIGTLTRFAVSVPSISGGSAVNGNVMFMYYLELIFLLAIGVANFIIWLSNKSQKKEPESQE